MQTNRARRIIGVVAIGVACLLAVSACSSDKKDNSSSTTTSSVAPTTSGVPSNSTLSKADVIQMQEWLDAVGCDVGNNDGIVGPLTIASLRNFQQGAGLTVDGLYGPKTKAALSADAQAKKKICTAPKPVPNPVGPTGNGAPCTSAALQTGLNAALPQGQTATINGFGCDSGWAYVWATINPPAGSTEPALGVTDVLAARNGTWVTQDRGTVCQQGKMPADIYKGGCLSN
jgi:hypothetical protein